MAKLAQSQFIATTSSEIVFDRDLTNEEYAALKVSKQEAVGTGHQVSPGSIVVDPVTGHTTYQNYWSVSADATAHVAVANGFDPAPISATVTTV